MKKQPYPITNLTGGLNVSLDPSFLEDKDSPEVLEVRYDKGLLKKDFGLTTFGLPVLGIPMLLESFYLTNGDVHTLCITTTSAYRLNTTLKEWEDITPQQSISQGNDAGTAEAQVTITNPAGKRGMYCTKIAIGSAFTTGLAAHFPIYS